MDVTRRETLGLLAGGLTAGAVGMAAPRPRRILFLAGPEPSHGYDTHAHVPGCRLLGAALRQSGARVDVTVSKGWPTDAALLTWPDAVVVYCDGFGRHLFRGHEDQVRGWIARGVGIGLLHYAVIGEPGPEGALLQDAIGGYYEPNWSVNPCWTAKFAELPEHAITAGVEPFRLWDEWYYHMRFRNDGAGVVTPLLSALPPANTLKRPDGPHSNNPHVRAAVLERKEPQHLAWAYRRADSGRGFGFTGGHRFWNLMHPQFQRLLLNAVLWLARAGNPNRVTPVYSPGLDELVALLGPPPKNWNRTQTEALLAGFAGE